MSFTPVTFEEAIEAKRITLPTGDPDCLDKAVLRSLIAKLSNPFGTKRTYFILYVYNVYLYKLMYDLQSNMDSLVILIIDLLGGL